MNIKHILPLQAMLFVAVSFHFHFRATTESIDTEGLKAELHKTCETYENIKKERIEEIRGLRAITRQQVVEYHKDALFFVPDEKIQQARQYQQHFLPLEAKFCYIAYKKEALNRMIEFVETKQNTSDYRQMLDGLQAGLHNDPYSVNLDRNDLRVIRATVKDEMEKLIIQEWSKTTAKRVESVMPQYQ